MSDSIDKLLERLKEIDLESYNTFMERACKCTPKRRIPQRDLPEHIKAAYEYNISLDDKNIMAILQATIQSIFEDHDWQYVLTYNPYLVDSKYSVELTMVVSDTIYTEGNTASSAMLRAYIKVSEDPYEQR